MLSDSSGKKRWSLAIGIWSLGTIHFILSKEEEEKNRGQNHKYMGKEITYLQNSVVRSVIFCYCWIGKNRASVTDFLAPSEELL